MSITPADLTRTAPSGWAVHLGHLMVVRATDDIMVWSATIEGEDVRMAPLGDVARSWIARLEDLWMLATMDAQYAVHTAAAAVGTALGCQAKPFGLYPYMYFAYETAGWMVIDGWPGVGHLLARRSYRYERRGQTLRVEARWDLEAAELIPIEGAALAAVPAMLRDPGRRR
jgi:hypothetical protein